MWEAIVKLVERNQGASIATCIAAALLLESQLLICLQDYAGAVAELGKYLVLRPDDADARKLAELATQATPCDPALAPAFSEVFSRQKAHYLAASLVKDTNKLFAVYKQRLDEAWPGMKLGGLLRVTKSAGFSLNFETAIGIGDFTPLKGMALTSLSLGDCVVRDLTPLKGMPLASSDLGSCSVTDLTALQGMPLRELHLDGSDVTDLSPLEGTKLDTLWLTPKRIVKGMETIRSMTTLTMIRLDSDHGWRPAEFRKKHDAGEFK